MAKFTLCQVGIYAESNLLAAHPSPSVTASTQTTLATGIDFSGSANVNVDQLLAPHPVGYSLFNDDQYSTGMAGGVGATNLEVYIEFDFGRAYTFSRFVIEGIRDETDDCQKQ